MKQTYITFVGFSFFVALFLCSAVSAQERSIHSVDFANFNFPLPTDLSSRSNRGFTLTNGEHPATRDTKGKIDNEGFHLESVDYGDVTGDSSEEAIVMIAIQTGGSSVPGIVYIYTWQKKPQLLWAKTTGDRANGGLRRAYAENKNLVLETNSPEGSRGDCCPVRFERTRYKWQHGKFRIIKRETLPVVN